MSIGTDSTTRNPDPRDHRREPPPRDPEYRARRIAELEEQHALARSLIAEKGGQVPREMRKDLQDLEAALWLERTLKTAEDKGHEGMPAPGQTYYTTAMPRLGSKGRSRRGLRFELGVRRKVEVVEPTPDAEMARLLKSGASIATPEGMLEILADPDLTSTMSAIGEDERGRLTAERDAAETRAAAAEKRVAELEAAARRNAHDPGDGSPGRLKATAKARTEAEGDKADKTDKPKDEPKG